MIAYLSIGNSDDKLKQAEWSQYFKDFVDGIAMTAIQIHGVWFSDPTMPYQNACLCANFSDNGLKATMEGLLPTLAAKYKQESIGVAIVEETIFVGPRTV